MKIAYIIECMHNSGGMERVLSVCANALCQNMEVSIITLYQKERPYYFPLDDKIDQYDLGIENVANRKQLKTKMKDFLMTHHFDVVISMGGIDMYYLHSIKDGSKKIVWFHFAIDIAETTWIGPHPNLVTKIKAKLKTRKRIYHARKYNKMIVISKTDLEAWKKHTNKAICIYNPITIDTPCVADNNAKAIISIGRLDYQKRYDNLINAWKIVYKKHPDWNLDIYGEGQLRNQLQKQIDKLRLSSSITLCGRTPNITEKYAQHSIYVMSSRAEGLGLVLLEAASCSLPLISYDCHSGPKDIIVDGKNGYLIPQVGDTTAMADRICKLIEDANLRRQMGMNAKLMVKKFSPTKIKEQWIAMLQTITCER